MGIVDMEELLAIASIPVMDMPLWAWGTFFLIVISILALDLGVLERKNHEISAKESIKLCTLYVVVACLYGLWVINSMGTSSGMEFFTGYLVEFSLSIDNIFVISLIFTYFAIPRMYQHRVLFWGILGAVLLRGVMIALGATLISQFAWILYVFGGFLIFSGLKMLIMVNEEPEVGDNAVTRLVRKYIKITPSIEGEHFFVAKKNAGGMVEHFATPLFLALVMVEISDVVFAVDSVPAIFGITQNTFIVYTSNIFAILGLRSLYFLLAAAVHRFKYLKHALSLVLIFIGSKIFITHFTGHISPLVSLVVTLALLSGGVLFSLYKTAQKTNA